MKLRGFLIFKFFLIWALINFFTTGVSAFERDDDPVVTIHDTVVAPGELLLQIDAFNFVGDNGMVSAITLDIDIDTCLIKFLDIQNIQISGGQWFANYNDYLNQLTVLFNADFGTGVDIDGKLLDLHLFYNGGFDANLHFKSSCEITKINLQNINVIYNDGLISQKTPVAGTVSCNQVFSYLGDLLSVPVIAEGSGYDNVNKIELKFGYSDLAMEYVGFTDGVLDDFTINENNDKLLICWTDIDNPVDLTAGDTLFYLKFEVAGTENSPLSLMPCSKVYNGDTLVPVASNFVSGEMILKYFVTLFNNPVGGGEVQGDGLYFTGDDVTITATPNEGYSFESWKSNDTLVTTSPVYSFTKQASNDTFVANYTHNEYSVTLNAVPAEGGVLTGGGVFYFGDTVDVVATPYEGYDFVAWVKGEDDTLSYSNEYSFIMPSEDVELKGIFSKKIFNIVVVPNDVNFGTVEGGGVYFYGDTAKLIATPYDNYKFVVWTEEGQDVWDDSVYSFVVNDSRSLVAVFQNDIECSAPVGLWVDSIYYDKALLHWTSSGDESEWKIIWGESGFDTVSEGTVVSGVYDNKYFLTGLNAGTVYQFYVKAICDENFESVWSEPFAFSTWYVGDTEQKERGILFYPNPVKDFLNISAMGNDNIGDIEVTITNMAGKAVYKNIFSNKRNVSIPLFDISNGVYFLSIKSGHSVIKSKLVIFR